MTLNEETLRFIREHQTDDVRTLALQAHKHPAVDLPAAIRQIAGRQAAQEKVPAWAAQEGIVYPMHLSLEQCSSELTARHKAAIIGETEGGWDSLTDLTGGFGIDCAFLSTRFRRVTYVERQEELCRIAGHNFPLLGLEHITVCHADGTHHLKQMAPADWIFIDPARRDGHGGKTVAIADCEPDVSALEPLLVEKARHVLVKLSPMLDPTLAMNALKHVQAAHIVSVGNECKELLLVLGREAGLPADDVPMCCTNLGADGQCQSFTFTRRQEKESPVAYTAQVKAYLYEPNASLLKAGAFRSISHIYKVEKLHPNSHLYTSDVFMADFPGRKFRTAGTCGFGKKELKELADTTRKANLTVRNFPAGVTELRKRLKLADGGDLYLFATTLADGKKALIRCHAAV